ncbi:MAG: hypothetical protein QOI50_927 [Pseudonocardiales bacterium]|nr:hypothetical protein [Pseudonocardiales bacterium]
MTASSTTAAANSTTMATSSQSVLAAVTRPTAFAPDPRDRAGSGATDSGAAGSVRAGSEPADPGAAG